MAKEFIIREGDIDAALDLLLEYEPVDRYKRQIVARKRNMRAKDGHEFATMPKRQLRMNLPDGAEELLGLGKGIYESKETNVEQWSY